MQQDGRPAPEKFNTVQTLQGWKGLATIIICPWVAPTAMHIKPRWGLQGIWQFVYAEYNLALNPGLDNFRHTVKDYETNNGDTFYPMHSTLKGFNLSSRG